MIKKALKPFLQISAVVKRQRKRLLMMRDKIKLVSSANTGHYYTTTKNRRATTDKIEIKKYDPVVRKHVIYKESKIK